jgi:hypothetical protein
MAEITIDGTSEIANLLGRLGEKAARSSLGEHDFRHFDRCGGTIALFKYSVIDKKIRSLRRHL